MISGISPRDLERLSAYLDKALSSREHSQLEQRLKADPSLAAALKAIESTRALLRRAPQRRTPHNFILTRAMAEAGQRRAWGGWNSLNLVSAAATLMLVVVLLGDYWASGGLSFGAAPAAEEPSAAFLAQEPDMKVGETATPEIGGTAPQPTEEYNLFVAPEEADRLMVDEPAPFELRSFMQQNARSLEFVLAFLALLTGLLAWRLRRQRT